MFKVGLDLPEVARETVTKKKRKNNEEPLTGNDLQKMLDELKDKKEEPSVKPKKAKREPKPEPEEPIENSEKPKPEAAKKNVPKVTPKEKPAPKEKLAPPKIGKNLTPLQLKMQQKLSGARFRWINEQLYTTDSKHSFDIFQKQPEVFKEYHDGFRHQVEQWPENPVDSFVEQFKERTLKPVNAPGGLPGDKSAGGAGKVVVADMGCGEAELALQLQKFNKEKRKRTPTFEVHSFDMHKGNERITVADIANVPLEDKSCHVVVFCLALMGTNLADFINEAIRILNDNGLVWIAEIKSRFEKNDYSQFVETLKGMGLYHKTTDDSNKMFVKFEFVKHPHKLAKAKNMHPDISLKPCIYKRR